MKRSTMIELNAAARLVQAEGEWFDMLSDEMKKLYIEEHPDSKYAKGYRLSRPSKPMRPGPNPKVLPKSPSGTPKLNKRTEESLKKLPKSVQTFVKKGGTKANSKSRKQSAAQVRAAAPKLARGILKDSGGVASGLLAMRNMLEFKPNEGDYKKAASLVGTILGTSVMMAALGASGPVGFLAFMAVKHVAAPALYNVVKDALAPGVKQKKPVEPKRDAFNSDFGYWKNKQWIPLSEDQYEDMSHEELDHWEKTGEVPERVKNNQPGHDNNDVEDVDFKEIPHSAAVMRLANLVTATDEEQQMIDLINGIAEFASSGDIPQKAWDAAIEEAAQVMNPSDEQDE